ncbi:MAG: hypothetical protein HS115_02525 [Spirochaetales bacterium]|nr:hypothetical protein [Spirochaetales bacterium]
MEAPWYKDRLKLLYAIYALTLLFVFAFLFIRNQVIGPQSMFGAVSPRALFWLKVGYALPLLLVVQSAVATVWSAVRLFQRRYSYAIPMLGFAALTVAFGILSNILRKFHNMF